MTKNVCGRMSIEPRDGRKEEGGREGEGERKLLLDYTPLVQRKVDNIYSDSTNAGYVPQKITSSC